MNNNPSQSPFYLNFLILLAGLGVAVILFILWRRLLGKVKPASGTPVVHLISNISLPATFLLIALALKWDVVRNALSVGPRFSTYIDAAVVFLAAFLLVRLVDAWILFRYERRQKPFPMPGVLHGFLRIILYLLVLFAVLKGMLGVNITPLLATSAIFTAIIGLAFQGVLSNLLAGISLNLTKSFGRGDWVKVGAHEGVVLDTNWRETLVFDRSSNVVVIPNNTMASEMIVNFSRPDKKTALTIPLKVGAGAPPAAVLEALREAAEEVPDVLATPAPQAYILSYDDLGISYLVKYWVADFARKHIINGEVARRIWYKFKRRGIEIPVALAESIKEVVGAVQPPEKERGRALELERTAEDLVHSSLFRYAEGDKAGQLIVSADEVREMAASVQRKKYTAGEVLFRQGEKGESCFIVAKGLVRGEAIYEEDGKRYTSVFEIGPGGIFGEMSLFSGLPRTATGVVEEEAELLEITAENFAGWLAGKPQLAEVIADVVSARNRQNAEFLRKIKELSEQDIEAGTSPHSILDRLKKLVARFRRSE